jgi:hypothetical protein
LVEQNIDFKGKGRELVVEDKVVNSDKTGWRTLKRHGGDFE